MSNVREDVRHRLTSELGDCCETDVDRRLAELRALRDRSGDNVRRDSELFATLGDETRLRLTRGLAAAERELCVCELTELADVSESAVSHALADLRAAGLVTREKRGKWRYYGTTDRAEGLFEALDRSREQAGEQR